jgi:hypothetical protein
MNKKPDFMDFIITIYEKGKQQILILCHFKNPVNKKSACMVTGGFLAVLFYYGQIPRFI